MKFILTFSLSVALLSAVFTGSSRAQLFDERPDILVCTVSQATESDAWDQFVFYISGTRVDGAILYKSLTSNPVLITVTKEGMVSAPNLADCDGKKVSELWQKGRAANFQRK